MAVLLFLLFCSLSFGGAALFRRKFEQALPLSFFALILILYVCGLCGSIAVGIWLVWALGAVALAFAAWSLWRRRVAWAQLLTPGLLAFALCFFGLWMLQTGRRPSLFDDFTHWATIVKNMFYATGFGNGPDTPALFRNYPPAMALLEFFFVKAGGAFREDMLFRASSIFVCVLQIPVFRHVSWRQAWKIPLLLPVVVFMPMLFFRDVYLSVYVDAALGLLLLYMLYAFLDGETGLDGKADAFSWLCIGLSAAVLTLTKPAGVGLALIGLLVIAVQRRTWRGGWGWLALPCGLAALAYVSWSVYFRSLNLPGAFANEGITLQNIAAFLQRRGPSYQYTVARNFLQDVVRTPHYGGSPFSDFSLRLTLLQVSALFCVLAGICAMLRPKEKRGEMARICVALMAGFTVYVASTLALYLFDYNVIEAIELMSIERYMGTYLVAVLGFLAYTALRDAMGAKGRARPVATALLCIAVMQVFVNWPVFRRTTFESQAQIAYAHAQLEPFEEVRDRLGDREGARVYFVAQGGSDRDLNFDAIRLYYVFSPHMGHDGWGPPAADEGQTPAQALGAALAEKGSTHVFLHHIDGEFAELYAALFEDPAAIAQGELFRVERDGEEIRLILMP
ncbi:MAG: hypothetical protein FWE77_04550 [Clostridia bacterium]|nr:hypothetical protein [Clostridia bacterium]